MSIIIDSLLFVGLIGLFLLHRAYVIRKRTTDGKNIAESTLKKLESYVETQERKIEKLGNEIRVTEKNAANILSRVQDTLEGLSKIKEKIDSDRADMEQINEKNKILLEVLPQAQDLKQQMQQLITQSQEQLSIMGERTSVMTSTLESLNTRERHVNDKFERLEGQIGSVIDSGKDTIQTLVVDLSTKVDDLIVRTNTRFKDAEEKSMEKYSSVLKEYSDGLEEKILLESQKLFSQMQSQAEVLNENRKDYKDFIDIQKQDLLSVKEEIFAEINGIIERKHDVISHKINAFEHDIEHKTNTIKAEYDEEIAKIRKSIIPIISHLDEIKTDTTEQHNAIRDQYEVLQQFAEDKNQSFKEVNERLQNQIRDIEEEVTEFKSNIEKEFDASSQEHINKWNSTIKKHEQSLVDSFSTLEEEMMTLKERHSKKILDMVQAIQKSLESKSAPYVQEAQIYMEEYTKTHKEQFHQIINKMQVEYAKKIEGIKENYEELFVNIEEKYGTYDKHFEKMRNEYFDQLDDFRHKIKSTEDVWEKQLSNLFMSIEERLRDHNESMNSEYARCEDTQKENMQNLELEFSAFIKDKKNTLSKDLQAIIETSKHSIDEIRDHIERMQEQSRQKITNVEEQFTLAEENITTKIESAQEFINKLVDKQKKQAEFIEQDKQSIQLLKKLQSDVSGELEKSESMLVELRSKNKDSEELIRKIDDITSQINTMKNLFDAVKEKESHLKDVIKAHENLSKQVRKIDVRTEKIDETIKYLHNQEEKISLIKQNLAEVQLTQKDIAKHKKELENSENRYNVALSTMDDIEKGMSQLEEKAKNMDSNMQEWTGRISNTENRLNSIEEQRKEIEDISAKVKATQKNIPNIINKLKEIEDTKGDIATLETRLLQIKESAEEKLTMLSLVTSPQQSRKNKNSVIDDKLKETIRGLYEFNFSPESIAKTLNISVSEVNLVLEKMLV